MKTPFMTITLTLLLGMTLLSSVAHAVCLKNCEDMTSSRTLKAIQPTEGGISFHQEPRQNSHNYGDMKNSVGGDMNIRVGHEKIEIGGLSNSTGNMIDTSINSVIVLGDSKQ